MIWKLTGPRKNYSGMISLLFDIMLISFFVLSIIICLSTILFVGT